MKQKLSLEKRQELEDHLSKNARFAPFIQKVREQREKSDKFMSEAAYYKMMVDHMRNEMMLKGKLKYSDPDLFKMDIETIGTLVKGLSFLVESLDKKQNGDFETATKALYDSADLLKKISEKTFVINIPEIKIPEIVVPETKVIQETAFAQIGNKILEGVLYELRQNSKGVFVKNEKPGDAIPVRIVDKGGKEFIAQLGQVIAHAIGGGGEGGSGSAPTNYSLETGGNLAAILAELQDVLAELQAGIDVSVGNPSTNYALETGGNLATVVTRLTSILAELQGTIDVQVANPSTNYALEAGGVLDAILTKLLASIAVTGSVTANAGTNLNTSALALESGGNLAAILAQLVLAVASLSMLDDWDESDRCKVNPIAGQAGLDGGSGAVSAKTLRAVLATDVGLPAGTALLGKTGRDTQATGGLSNVTSVASNVTLLAANANRKHVIIFNDSNSYLKIKYGATASATSFTDKIPPMWTWEMTGAIYTGVIDGIWDTANGSARITEL